LYEEDIVLWTLISAKDFNITYGDVKNMTENEKLQALLALNAINRRRNKKRK